MTRIDIFSGFLGAGKTTLIKKLITEAYQGEKLVLIENEFGEIGIDGGFLSEAGIQINEMNSGCICCSLVGDFAEALKKVIDEYHPDRILIEPSGVGKLSDVIAAVKNANTHGTELNGATTVVDANKCKMHMKNFGEFFNNQIENAACIILSHTEAISDAKISECVALIREHNPGAVIVSTSWDQLSGAQIIEAMEQRSTLATELEHLEEEAHRHHDHEHHHHDGECCHHEHEHEHHHHDGECCHHEHEHEHHHHDGECCHHEHEHHHHDGECCHHDHEHHHHDGECCHHEHEHHHHDGECCHHEHEHHHHDGECCHHDHEHHHADEVFVSYGAETTKKFNEAELKAALESFANSDSFGMILRAKGIVAGNDGRWIHFDYIPGEPDVRYGGASVIGRLCVIGSQLDKTAISEALGVELK